MFSVSISTYHKQHKSATLESRFLADGSTVTYASPEITSETIIQKVSCNGTEKTIQACWRDTVESCDKFAGVQCKGKTLKFIEIAILQISIRKKSLRFASSELSVHS